MSFYFPVWGFRKLPREGIAGHKEIAGNVVLRIANA